MLNRSRGALFAFLVLASLLTLPLQAQTVYYLSGGAGDQATKATQTPGTATFTTTAPTGTAPVTQTGSWLASTDVPGDPLSFYWSGPYSGSVSGVLDLNCFWSTQNGETIALGATVDVTVFADPDYSNANPQPDRIIGTLNAFTFPISATPAAVHILIPVSGTIQHTLHVQIVPHYSDDGNLINAYYAATSTPSSFTFHATPVRVPFPAAAQGSGAAPRFALHTPTSAQIASGLGIDAGEPSIGSNWISGNAMFQSFTTSFRVSFDDSCPTSPGSTWTAKQSPITGTESFDPILYTDHTTGRTIVSQLLFGTTESASALTDNDGDLWLPSQGAGIASGIDHQTVGGGGPFHAPIPTGAAYPNAIYYCAQAEADANCAISLDGGLTYGPAVPIYTSQQCGALHGHVKVGPDGTAYVPNKDCGGQQAVVVSEDNGVTWNVRPVPNSLAANSDPSVGISKGGRIYFGFIDNDNHPVVAVSDDHGNTWYNVYDVGAAAGINNAVFAETVAGDDSRAAFAFLGTTSKGDLEGREFPGVWYLWVAATYDGGKTWQLTNATPNDPVQRGPIWLQGGSEISRNLLDFNDATIDAQGRLLIAFADGCVGACSQAPNSARGNAYTEIASIARQSGGRRMFSQFDPPTPTAPGAPALTVTRNGSLANLSWSEGNDGGSAVTKYSIYRTPSGGSEKLVATVGNVGAYTDPTADPSTTYTYRVAATNAVGTSCGSNAVTAAPAGSSCALPGVTIITDPSGDQNGAPANTNLDIQSVSIAEPYYADGSQKIVFTIKVADLSSLPPSSQWRVIWDFPTNTVGEYYAEMHTDSNGVVGWEYGTLDVTGAVVTAVAQPHPLGAADSDSSYTPDGYIHIVLSTNKIGNPVAGDLIGGLVARTYIVTGSQVTTFRAAIDQTKTASTYEVVGNGFCAPPVVNCLEDDASQIAYSNGWHLVSDPDASAGHFRMGVGKASATLTFSVPAGQFGAVTYFWATSPKGGTADVLLDGVPQGTISYAGPNGTTKAPAFGFSQRYAGLQPGTHTLQINGSGTIYVDRFCLESSSSNAQPSSGPGATSANSTSLVAGQSLVSQLTLPSNAQAISIVAESSAGLVQVALVDPTGLTLATADTSSGLAVINAPVTAGGVYLVKLINAGVGPVNVWTMATPLVSR
jgi:hypothetical protein